MRVVSSIISIDCIIVYMETIEDLGEMAIAWGSFGKCIARSSGLYGKDERLLIRSIGLVRRDSHSIVPCC